VVTAPTLAQQSVQAPPKNRQCAKKLDLEQKALLLGYVCSPLTNLQKSLANSMAVRLRPREGLLVYQTAAFHCDNFPVGAAEQLLPAELLTLTLPKVKTWTAATMAHVLQMVAPILEASDCHCVGTSRALQTASERVIRVIATIMPLVEISWAEKQGSDRLYVNFQFVLASEHGQLYPPKDEERREIALSPQLQTDLRRQILVDIRGMAGKGFPLAPGFLRQLGREAAAQEVEARLLNLQQQQAASSAQAGSSAAPLSAKKPRTMRMAEQESYEVDCIVEERSSTGKAERWYLVRWAGYHPSWEAWRAPGQGSVGDPVETWEPLATVRTTEALAAWKAAAAAAAAAAPAPAAAAAAVAADTGTSA
jgi:hypothetical protein